MAAVAEPADRGILAWLVDRPVTVNLMMIALVVGGLLMAGQIRQEVFPAFELDAVSVSVGYPGANPTDIEQGIVLPVENAVRAIDGIKEVRSTASSAAGTVTAEVVPGYDVQRVLQEIDQAVGRIDTFPDGARQPTVSIVSRRIDVLELELFGPVDPWTLRAVADRVLDGLLRHPGITQAEIENARDLEILVDVPSANLRRYGLNLQEVADRIGRTAMDLPAGSIDTSAGSIALRFNERRDWAEGIGLIPILTTGDGSVVRLEQIASVRDGFADTERESTFNGQPAISIEVFRIGEETPVGVSAAVREAMAELAADLPPGIAYAINRDRSVEYGQRLDLLLRNAALGLALVLVMLSLFLEFRLAFWVASGIATAFAGALLVLPVLGVSINMISMFAFIIALGIVVDDAIIVGENIHAHRQMGLGPRRAAVRGTQEVAVPVSVAVLTNVVAFLPIAFVPGALGQVWAVIPVVVTCVFLLSWFESLMILPAHLAAAERGSARRGAGATGSKWANRQLERFVDRLYLPALRRCLAWRYLCLAIGLGVLMVSLAYAMSGRMGFQFMPRVEGDVADVSASQPAGASPEQVRLVRDRLVRAAQEVVAENGGEALSTGIAAGLNGTDIRASIYLTDPETRPLSTAEVTRAWRQRAGDIPGLDQVLFQSDRGGPGGGRGLTVQLRHRDVEVLERAAGRLAAVLGDYPQVADADDGFQTGTAELSFRLNDAGRSLGLTTQDVASQLRAAVNGVEALRQQRGQNEVTVRVRLPESERRQAFDVERLPIRTPAGAEVLLTQVATIDQGVASTRITRIDGQRTVSVSANVEPPDRVNLIETDLLERVFPTLEAEFPGLVTGFGGRQADTRDTLSSLGVSFSLALVGMYALLAFAFQSYSQPAIVMLAIPFGAVGAILGHMVMGYSLSVVSVLGLVALAGVVVNDSLVMVDFANGARAGGADRVTAMLEAGRRRFRPILLTTITTFGGLAPMIFETSRQARFLIPMAISLGYGILFTTALMLIVVPCLYVALDDLLRLGARKEPERAPAE